MPFNILLNGLKLLPAWLMLTACLGETKRNLPNDSTLKYHLNLDSAFNGAISTRISLVNDTVAYIQVIMPDRGGCATEGVTELTVHEGVEIRDDKSSTNATTVEPNAMGQFEISMSVSPLHRALDFNTEGLDKCFPVISGEDLVYFEGKSVIPFIKAFDKANERVFFSKASMSWQLDPSWVAHSSLQSFEKIKAKSVANLIWGSQFMVGDLDVLERDVGDNSFLVTTPKNFNFDAEKITDVLVNAHLTYSKFYGELASIKHSTFILPVTTNDGQYDILASAEDTSNVIVIRNGNGYNEVGMVAAHELAHRWIPIAISGTWDSDLAWLSEGVVEYAALSEVSKNNHFSSEEFVHRINQALYSLEFDKKASPYNVGLLVGLSLDENPHNSTVNKNALHGFVQNMIKEKAGAQNFVGVKKIFNQTMSEYDVFENVPPPSFSLPFSTPLPCTLKLTEQTYKLSLAKFPSYQIGFEIGPAPNADYIGVIENILNTHNAATSGIRNGYKIVEKLSGGNGDIHTPIRFTVENFDGVRTTVAYLPHGDLSHTTFLQYTLVDAAPKKYNAISLTDIKCVASNN